MAESLPEQCEQFYSAAQNQEALSVCRAAAEAGHCESQANLAWLYVWGLDTKDPASGFSWMTRAARCGSARAKNNLGILYREGIGTAASDAEAVRWFRSAADQGEASAMRQLAAAYKEGKGVPQSSEESQRLLLRAADIGEVQAFMDLAEQVNWMYGREGMVWLQRAARSGNTFAQYLLGSENLNLNRDNTVVLPKLLRWLERAVENGSLDAKCELADHYFNYGVNSGEYAKAIPMYMEIAETKNPVFEDNRKEWCPALAMSNLAKAYREGRGVTADVSKTAYWYRRASDAGWRSDTYRLALSYFDGVGVKKDPAEGNRLLMLVRADKSSFIPDDALYQLAKSHALGRGTKKSPEKALEFLRESSYSKYLPYTDDVSKLDKSGWARLYEANVLLSGELGESLQKTGKNLLRGLVDDYASGKFSSKTLNAVIRDQGKLLGFQSDKIGSTKAQQDAYEYIGDTNAQPPDLPPLLPNEPAQAVWLSWMKQFNDKLRKIYPQVSKDLVESFNEKLIGGIIPANDRNMILEISIVDILRPPHVEDKDVTSAIERANQYMENCGIKIVVLRYGLLNVATVGGPLDVFNWEGETSTNIKKKDLDFRHMPASSRPRVVIWNEGEQSERDWGGFETNQLDHYGGTGAIAIYASTKSLQDPGRSHIPSTLAHEVGHLLGLPHANHFKRSFMSYVYDLPFAIDEFKRFDESECRTMRQSPYLHRTRSAL